MTTARSTANSRSSRSKKRTMAVQVRRSGVGMACSLSQPAPRARSLLTARGRAARVGAMSFLGSAILAFWADVEPAGEADFNDWHTREHMPERVGVPGLPRGRPHLAGPGRAKDFMV